MKTIAIASGKGGTGKTFLSTNLFRTMLEAGLDVTLVDCDAEVPNDRLFIKGRLRSGQEVRMFCPEIDGSACTHCNACAEVCRYNAITSIPAMGYIKVHPELCHSCKGCLYFCKDRAIRPSWKTIGRTAAAEDCPFIEARMNEGEHSPVPVIQEAIELGKRSGSGYLLLDAPPGCSCPFVNTVVHADTILLVTEPTPFGLSDLKHSISVLKKLGKDYKVVINKAGIGNGEMKGYLETENIGIIAEIPYSQELAACYSQGQLAVDQLREIRDLFQDLMYRII